MFITPSGQSRTEAVSIFGAVQDTQVAFGMIRTTDHFQLRTEWQGRAFSQQIEQRVPGIIGRLIRRRFIQINSDTIAILSGYFEELHSLAKTFTDYGETRNMETVP